jgi:hypothetical protein
MVYEHVREQCIHELYNRILAHLLKSGNGGQMTTDGSMCHDARETSSDTWIFAGRFRQ